jgi:hypothetical protein
MATVLTELQVAQVALSGLDAQGNPAPVYNPTAVVDNAALATAVVNADGSVTVTSLGPLGTVTVTFTATDAAVSGNVLTTTLVFTVGAGKAVTLVAVVTSITSPVPPAPVVPAA